MHQPLHTDNLLRGGNSIQVLWNGRETNLHHVWDSAISEKLVGGNTVRHAATWADALYTEITAGKWKDATAGWGACVDPKTAGDCALLWAQETNTWMCKYVLPATYPEGFAGSELNGTYYDGAIEVVEELVAIAGWRMGMWLNAMFPDESSAAAQEL